MFADQFNVDQLPIGAEITLPGAAKTLVPVATRVKVSATDSPQTISIVPITTAGTAAVPLMLSIYDKKLDRATNIKLTPGAPFLYSFKGLSEITLHSKAPPGARGKTAAADGLRLKIESDKPLTVGR